ncbi:metal ABC transporter permease [Klebsiella pneumoniae]|uniref:metal ABC transporter permease n=1 Tax=Klebsiella pneumoniae TaxID=573 RepID=UPI00396F6386
MWVSALVGGVCAFLSCYLMLKGWSLIGDALSLDCARRRRAYMLGLPFALGAFLSAVWRRACCFAAALAAKRMLLSG